MTGTHNLHGPSMGGNVFGQIGRWISVAVAALVGLFMLSVSAVFAFLLIGGIAVLALVTVAVFWIRAKLTGRPFGPRAMMEARMEELRSQMGAQMANQRNGQMPPHMAGMFGGDAATDDDGPVIDAHQTPQGWTVER